VEIGEADPRLEVLEVVPSSYEQGIQVSMTLRYIPADITEQLLYDFNQEAHSVLGGSISNNNQQTASAGTGY